MFRDIRSLSRRLALRFQDVAHRRGERLRRSSGDERQRRNKPANRARIYPRPARTTTAPRITFPVPRCAGCCLHGHTRCRGRNTPMRMLLYARGSTARCAPAYYELMLCVPAASGGDDASDDDPGRGARGGAVHPRGPTSSSPSGPSRLPAPVDAVLVGSTGGAGGRGSSGLIIAGGKGAGIATVWVSAPPVTLPGSQKPDVVVQVRPSSPVQVVVLPTVLQVPPSGGRYLGVVGLVGVAVVVFVPPVVVGGLPDFGGDPISGLDEGHVGAVTTAPGARRVNGRQKIGGSIAVVPGSEVVGGGLFGGSRGQPSSFQDYCPVAGRGRPCRVLDHCPAADRGRPWSSRIIVRRRAEPGRESSRVIVRRRAKPRGIGVSRIAAR